MIDFKSKAASGGSRTARDLSEANLSFEGNGRVSVPVASIIKSPEFRRQIKAVQEIAARHQAARKK